MIGRGKDHFMVLTENYDVWSKGSNDYGQLGYRSFGEVYRIKKIETKYKFISVSCGDNHTLLLSRFRSVLAFGDNRNGQLGIINKNKIK